MIQFDIITIFPTIFDSYFNTSIIKRAQEKGLIKIKIHDLRQWATGKHKSVDDRPYGGGPGMILKIEPIYKALCSILRISNSQFPIFKQKPELKTKVILTSAAGKQFDQKMAYRLAQLKRIIFICGRYEGIDARVDRFVDEKISTGPYVLTGGELPAATIIDAITRLIPGVINKESLEEETFTFKVAPRQARGARISNQTKVWKKFGSEYPQYTRPETLTFSKKRAIIKKMRVPKVLISGNHQKIDKWRTGRLKIRNIS